MTSQQFYKYSTWVLLLMNLSMVVFFLLTKPPIPPSKGQNAPEILDLNEEQRDLFKSSVDQQRKRMSTLSEQQKTILKPYFSTLADEGITIDEDTLFHQLSELERNKIESIYQHFEEVKSMLKPEQRAGFDEFLDHVLERLLSNEEKRHPPEKGRE